MSVSDPWDREDGRRRAPARGGSERPLAELADRLAEARRAGEPAPEELESLVAMLAKSDIDPGDRLTQALEGLARWSDERREASRHAYDEPRSRRVREEAPRRPAPRNPIPEELEQRFEDYATSLGHGRAEERDRAPRRREEEPRRESRPAPRAPERVAAPTPPIASLRAALAEISARQKALDAESDAPSRRETRAQAAPRRPEPQPQAREPEPRYSSGGRVSASYAPAAPARVETVSPAVMRELRSEIDRLGKSVTDLPTRAEIDRLTRGMSDLATRLTDERPARLDRDSLTAIDSLVAEVDRMRADAPSPQAISQLSEELHAISARLDVIGPRNSNAIDALAKRIEDVRSELDQFPRTSSVDDVAVEIKSLISRLDAQEAAARPTREAVVGLAGRVQALDGQIAAIAEATAARDVALERINATIRSELDSLPRADAVSDLGRQIDALTEGLKSRSAIGPALKAVEGLAGKVDALDGKIAAIATRRSEEAGWLTDAMRDEIAAVARPDAVESLSRQIETLTDRLASERREPIPVNVDALTSQIEGLGERFDTMAAATRSRGAAFERVEESIRAIAEQLLESRAPAEDAPRVVSHEISLLAERLERSDERIEDLHEAFSGIATRIERSCADLGVHVTQSAVAAARDVLGSSAGDGRLESEFADVLAELRASSEKSERRAADALDAVRSTLERLLDRMENYAQPALAAAEPERAAPFGRLSEPAPAQQPAAGATEAARAAARRAMEEIANDLEDELEDRPAPRAHMPHVDERPQFRSFGDLAPDYPIEPGGALPQADDDTVQPAPKSAESFIASARRASLQSVPEPVASVQGDASAKKNASLFSGVLASLRKSKRPMLFGVAAVLIVFTALYVASGMTGGDPEEAAPPPPPPASQSRAAPADEPRFGAYDPKPLTKSAPALARADAEAANLASGPDETAEPPPLAPEPKAASPAAAATAQLAAPRAEARDLTNFAFADGGPAVPKAGSVDWKTAEPATTGSISRDPNGLPQAIGGPVLRTRALAGDAAAELEVADRLLDGRNVEANPAGAAKWLEKAAAQGLAPAQHRLGSLYEKGRGVPRDISTARRWYEQAAASGNVRAMHNLGVVHAEGGLGKPDYGAAVVWFRMAAERGLTDSAYNLAVLQARGLGGKRDLVEAYKWFALAAAQGDEDAAKKRDEVGKALGASITVARAAVDGFKAKPIDPAANDPQPPAGGWDRVASRSGAPDAATVR